MQWLKFSWSYVYIGVLRTVKPLGCFTVLSSFVLSACATRSYRQSHSRDSKYADGLASKERELGNRRPGTMAKDCSSGWLENRYRFGSGNCVGVIADTDLSNGSGVSRLKNSRECASKLVWQERGDRLGIWVSAEGDACATRVLL